MDEEAWTHWYWIEKWREDPVNNLHYLDRLWKDTRPGCIKYLMRKTTVWERNSHLPLYWGNIHLRFMKMVEKYKTEYGSWLYFMNLGLRDAIVDAHREYYSHKQALISGTNSELDIISELPDPYSVEQEVVYKDYVYQWVNSLNEKQKEIALLRLEGCTLREVATITNKSFTSIHYNLQKMKRLWEVYDQGESV